MKVGIIGGGAIGLLLGGYLSKHHQVTLYSKRAEQIRQLNKHGIELRYNEKESRRTMPKAVHIEKIQQHKDDCLFVCVKQPQLASVLPRLEEMVSDIPMVFLQNGMGHIGQLEHFTPQSIIGIVEHGATKVSDHQVNHLGNGAITLAPFSVRQNVVQHLVHQLNDSAFPFKYTADYEPLMQQKLIVNAVINPLTALYDVENGEIVTNKHMRHLAEKLCSEAAQILRMDEQQAWLQIEHTAKNTASNSSSMRADLRTNRQTEMKAISGYLLKRAEKDAPYTAFVYHSILGLEKRGKKDGTVS